MNFKSIKIIYVFDIIFVVILFSRFTKLFDLLKLFYFTFKGIFFDPDFSSAAINWFIIDALFTVILVFLYPLFRIFFYKKLCSYRMSIKITHWIIAALIFCFLFAPLISTHNPNLQHDLRVAKLLSPLCSKKSVVIENRVSGSVKINSQYTAVKDKLFREYEDKNYFTVDSILSSEDGSLKYIIEKELITLSKDSLKSSYIQIKVFDNVFIFGTDELGRDIFSRTVYGIRTSISIGIGAIFIAIFIGFFAGFISGYGSNAFIKIIFNRIIDMFLSIPSIFLILFFIALLGNSYATIIIVLGFSGWMSLSRVIREQLISVKSKDFIITSKQLGYSNYKIFFWEILPVIKSPIIINLVFLFANVVLAEAALSFLGLGIQHSVPTLGGMISKGQQYLSEAWWLSFFPGITLFLIILFVRNVGNKLEKIFIN